MITSYKKFLAENNTTSKPEDFGITKYKWVNGLLDCYQDVEINEIDLISIPFPFGKIDGCFLVSENLLTSLEGCPHTVNGNFSCYRNQLTSLEYCPQIIEGYFSCSKNKLTNLLGGPQIVNGDYHCNDNIITSLEYCPKSLKSSFYCFSNELKSIEDYPLCDIKGKIDDILGYEDELHFVKIHNLYKQNLNIFKPLLEDKIKFHQMVMRINPSLIQYYETIQPPSKKTIL